MCIRDSISSNKPCLADNAEKELPVGSGVIPHSSSFFAFSFVGRGAQRIRKSKNLPNGRHNDYVYANIADSD